MLEHDLRKIGNHLLSARKKKGLTQIEVAEAANISDRSYAEIERGNVNMRLETFLRICDVLSITPNDVLVCEDNQTVLDQQLLFSRLSNRTKNEQNTALQLLSIYIDSLN